MKMRKFFALTAAAAIVAALGFSAEAAEAADRPLAGDKKALVVCGDLRASIAARLV